MRARLVFLIILSVLALPLCAVAQDAPTPVVQARLVAENKDIAQGQAAQIGLYLNVPGGWHIYGASPGEVGLPTTITFHAPDGFSLGPIRWPAEEGFIFQGATSSGYQGDVLLPAVLTPPLHLKLGDKIHLSAQAAWLVCKDICVPENADLLLTLPVAASAHAGKEAGLFTRRAPSPLGMIDISFWEAVACALLGGLMLNLMPCVFPILSMKALGLIKKSHYEKRAQVAVGGLAYASGVLASFWGLAAVLILFKNAGLSVGWGVQLQSPALVALLAVVLFLIGLSLSDIIRINGRFFGFGQNLTQRSGHWGSFFTGALAVWVASPCTAPFMGGAMFYAFTQNWPVTAAVFTALGLGLAAPYLFLTLYPPALKKLPRPGPWMARLKKILAWPLYAAALWLVWVFVQQVGVLPRFEASKYDEPYSAQRLAELRAAHQPVFVDITAAWCITCIFNEKNSLADASVQKVFAEKHVVYLKGDWTRRDPDITAFLRRFGRVGVPLYVYFPAEGEPKLLPQILTPRIIMNKVSGA